MQAVFASTSSALAAGPAARVQFTTSRSHANNPLASPSSSSVPSSRRSRRGRSLATTATATIHPTSAPFSPPPGYIYLCRDTQRHDKLTGLLSKELDAESGLTSPTQIALAKDLILRGIGLEDPDMLAEDFVYETCWSEPLNKADYLKAELYT